MDKNLIYKLEESSAGEELKSPTKYLFFDSFYLFSIKLLIKILG